MPNIGSARNIYHAAKTWTWFFGLITNEISIALWPGIFSVLKTFVSIISSNYQLKKHVLSLR